jgi:hypothetical protein
MLFTVLRMLEENDHMVKGKLREIHQQIVNYLGEQEYCPDIQE